MLRDYFPNFVNDGALFVKMTNAPWPVEVGKEMDIAYLAWYSGVKKESITFEDFMSDGVVNQNSLSSMIWSIYGTTWEKLWLSYTSEYNPLSDYHIEESESYNDSNSRTVKHNYSDEISDNGSISNESSEDTSDKTTVTYGKIVNVDTESDMYSYGFNSEEKVPTNVTTDTSKEVQSGVDTTQNTGNTSSTSKDTTSNTRNASGDDSTTDSGTSDGTTDRIRTGMSGRRSYQELLLQEFEVWKWNFYVRVFEDCDKVLVLSVY